MNKIKIIFKKIKFKLFALFGLLTIFGGCLLSNNSYAWFVNEQGNLESSNLYLNESEETFTQNNVTMRFPSSQSYCYLSGYNDTDTDLFFTWNIFEGLEFGKTYTFSTLSSNLFAYECWYNEGLGGSDIHYITNNGVLTINLTEGLRDNGIWRFVVHSGFDNASPLQLNFMVVEGSNAMAYEPFGKVYFSSNNSVLQSEFDNLQQNYNVLENSYNNLNNTYNQLITNFNNLNIENNNNINRINQLTNDVATLQNLITSLRSQVEDNFGWQNLFFGMADTPFRVVANVLGFDVFGINLFTTFIGLTTTLAVIYLLKRFI